MPTILLVDDQDVSRITTKWVLTNFGYVVDSVRGPEEALALFDPRVHDLVLTDNSMPVMSGKEMAHIIKMRSPTTRILMYSGHVPENLSCVDGVVQKPAHVLALKQAVDKVLANK